MCSEFDSVNPQTIYCNLSVLWAGGCTRKPPVISSQVKYSVIYVTVYSASTSFFETLHHLYWFVFGVFFQCPAAYWDISSLSLYLII